MRTTTLLLLAAVIAAGCIAQPKPPVKAPPPPALPSLLTEELEEELRQTVAAPRPIPDEPPPADAPSREARLAVLLVQLNAQTGEAQRYRERLELLEAVESEYMARITPGAEDVTRNLETFKRLRQRREAELRRHEEALARLKDAVQALEGKSP